MDIRSKEELRSVIRYERELWKARMYPHGAPSKVRNITLVYMNALRKVEFYGKLSKMRKILGGVHLLENYIQDTGLCYKCFYSPICIWEGFINHAPSKYCGISKSKSRREYLPVS